MQRRAGPQDRISGNSPHGVLGALHTTLGAGSLIQGLSALAGFAVLPLLVETLGSAEFGALMVIVSFGLWLTVLDTGLQAAERIVVGEYRGRAQGRAPAPVLRRGFRLALAVAAINGLCVLLVVTFLPLSALLGAEGVVPDSVAVEAVVAFSLPLVLSPWGVVPLGALEGVGRTVAAAVISGIGPLVALPLTFAAASLGAGLVVLAFIQGFAMAAPRLAALAYWRWKPSAVSLSEGDSVALRVSLVGQLALLAALALAQTGLAPVIVSSELGSDAAATYGIALRMVIGALVPLSVLTPFLTGAFAAARGSGWSARRTAEFLRMLGLAALAGFLAGAALILIGPFLATLLGRGEVEMPTSVLVAGAAYVAATYVATPLQTAFTGPRALRVSVSLGVVLTVVAVGLSLILTPVLGPAGPFVGAAAASIVAILTWAAAWRLRPTLLADSHTRQLT